MKLKKVYQEPGLKVLETNLEASLLTGSGEDFNVVPGAWDSADPVSAIPDFLVFLI